MKKQITEVVLTIYLSILVLLLFFALCAQNFTILFICFALILFLPLFAVIYDKFYYNK